MSTNEPSPAPPPPLAPHPRPSARARAVAATGVLAVLLYASLATVQILVLNPLAAAPGRSLTEIFADAAAENQPMWTGFVIAFEAFGVALALALAVVMLRTRALTPRGGFALFLLLLAAGSPAYEMASFGPGMSLADTYGIGGADYAPWGSLLHLISLTALCVLAGIGVFSTLRRTRAAPSPPAA